MTSVAILGATGSIGTQALQVIDAHKDKLSVEVITANKQADALIALALKHNPNAVVIADQSLYPKVKEALSSLPIKVYAGYEALSQVVTMSTVDLVLSSLVGFAGLKPTLSAIRAGKPIALANKETLVTAGELVSREAAMHKVPLIPVDSEHSAIFQCLQGEFHNSIEKLILTASGGPFRGKSLEELSNVTCKDALCHPNWNMGNKVTIDSATLMNKAFEVMEAKWLFGVDANKIEVVVHPQSIVHSLVQFEDGSLKAQLGLPDMKLPIQYALTYPMRIKSEFPRFSFANCHNLTFEQPDMNTFRCLSIGLQALSEGGNRPCIVNAANEVAVGAFLADRIRFNDIPNIIINTLDKFPNQPMSQLEDYEQMHAQSMLYANSLI